MQFRKPLLLVAVLLLLICAEITSAESFSPSEEEGFTAFPAQDDAVSHSTAAGASSELELQWLKSKISYLEKSIEEKTGELKQKHVSIEHLEKVIEEKSNVLVTLQSTLQSRQGRASVHVNERFGEVNSRVNGIEKQVAGLKKEIEAQNQKKSELQVRASIAEKKITGMNLKLENLRRINDEQKSKIRNAQRAPQVAEEEMLKAMVEASSVAKQLEEVHQAWLPTWLSTHLVHFQSSVIAHWNKYGKPALDLTIQEARKRKSEAEEWMQPHVETFKTKWIPTIEKRCKTFVDDFQPLVQSLSTQAIDYCHVAHGTIKPHVIKVLEVTGPYFQVHQAWLPTWLSTHLVHFQSSVIAHWNKYGKPALDLTIQEARKRKSEAEEWMQPHVETFKTKWIPTIEKRCKTFVDDFQPLVQSLSTQAIDYCHVAHGTIKPHVIKVLEVTGPYFQVHQAWLPTWLSTHLVHFQSSVIAHWNKYGKPALDLTIQEARKRKSEAEEWMQPHVETFKTKWIPTIEKRCKTFVDDFQPLVQSLSTQAIDYCHVAHGTIKPHVIKVLEVTGPYFQVHQAWLPTWLSTHLVHFQSSVIAHWNKYGKPALDLTIQEARKRKSEAEEWMQPHVETFKTKWIPTIEKRCKTFVDDFQPLVQSLSTQAIDYCHVAHGTIKPHVIKVLEVTGPYFQVHQAWLPTWLSTHVVHFQSSVIAHWNKYGKPALDLTIQEEAKMLTKPYIDQVSRNAKPHVDKLVRYRKRVTKICSLTTLLKVQATIHETLRSYVLTKPLATSRLVWLTASVLMAMPLVALSMILLRKEPTKRRRRTQKTSHTQRRSKRSHQDK